MALNHCKGCVFQCINFFSADLERHKQAPEADRINHKDPIVLPTFL